jgi:hypothetical protein
MKAAHSGRLSRRTFGTFILAALAGASTRGSAAGGNLLSTAPERRLRFDVVGLDQVIGRHEVLIEGTSAAFVVRSDVEIDVSPLGIPLFTYRHSGTETWK